MNTSMYVGEWHTHPQEIPIPSGQDIKNWKKLARKANSEVDIFFFVIIGTVNIGIWSLERKTSQIKQIYGGTLNNAGC